MDFTLVCDIMIDLEGSIRPAMYLARELKARGHRVSMMSPMMSKTAEERLIEEGIVPINLKARLATNGSGMSVLWLETWSREAFLRLNSRRIVNDSSTILNFSQVISVPSAVWYLQGPPSIALKDMERELSRGFKFAYGILKPLIEYADRKLVKRMGDASSKVIANSKFCASMYSSFGIRVDDVIYPPIDCQKFRPSTSHPSSDYVLTYFGKETKFSMVEKVAEKGLKIQAFGSKTPFIPKNLLRHPNVTFLGRVSEEELVTLYSNALFTIFPFTHEPFGYIPLESMACGTPVLTYDTQGPGEYVVNGHTGWLVRTENEFLQKSTQLWNEEHTGKLRARCVKEASKYDVHVYVDKWIDKLNWMIGESHFDILCEGAHEKQILNRL
jgi:glycosyltransferase involved in cell wall biosynthesis